MRNLRKKSQVLVYCAGEPVRSKMVSSSLKALATTKDHGLREFVDRCAEDLQEFCSAVRSEVSMIRDQFVACGGKAIVATNSDLSRGRVKWSSGGRLRTKDIARSESSDGLPLSSPKMLSQVLDLAVELFPPAEHDYVLVTKGHGNRETTLGSAGSVLGPRGPHRGLGFFGLGSFALGTYGLGIYGLQAVALQAGVPIPGALIGAGMPKADYLATLKRPIPFGAVFTESCESCLPGGLTVPDNVEQIFTTENPELPYQSIDYATAWDQVARGSDLVEALASSSPEFRSVTPR